MATVFVGLSGGVDSAVSAALLKDQGHDVVGAFIKIWQPEFTECSWQEDRLDAMRVAAALSIPFKEIDLSEQYKHEIVRTMVEGYSRGETPNPDVLCNQKIKFGSFADWAFREGAEKIATGHYARICQEGRAFSLLRGVDPEKDQSYFLSQLNESVISRTIFPVGDMTKKEVRAYAARTGLPVAKKADSQGLCFVGPVTIREFLGHYIPLKRGVVLNENHEPVGAHEGAALYTIGQRHGFSVDAPTSLEAHYVIALDMRTNTITISPTRSKAARKTFSIASMHWIGNEPKLPLLATAQVRYRGERISARVTGHKQVRVELDRAEIASPGQSLVLYDGNRVLGGGVISA